VSHPGFTFTFEHRKGTDIIDTPGVDFGGKMRLVYREGLYAVVRVPGGSHWASLGARSSHPASWMIVKVEHVRTSAESSLNGVAFERDRATVLSEYEPERHWRACRAHMVIAAQRMARGLDGENAERFHSRGQSKRLGCKCRGCRSPRCACGGFWQSTPLPFAFVHADACNRKQRAAFMAECRAAHMPMEREA
jgi:hypothetical protein